MVSMAVYDVCRCWYLLVTCIPLQIVSAPILPHMELASVHSSFSLFQWEPQSQGNPDVVLTSKHQGWLRYQCISHCAKCQIVYPNPQPENRELFFEFRIIVCKPRAVTCVPAGYLLWKEPDLNSSSEFKGFSNPHICHLQSPWVSMNCQRDKVKDDPKRLCMAGVPFIVFSKTH